MSNAYQKVNAGRLTFKGGEVAGADKSKKRKNKNKKKEAVDAEDGIPGDATVVGGEESSAATGGGGGGPGEAYTIDAAKKLKYEELFPVESKKFRYDPDNKSRAGNRTVEEALDDRVRKKADRYCK